MPRVGGHCVACETLPPLPVLCLPSFTRRLPSYTSAHTEPLSSRGSARTTTTTTTNPKKTMAAASAQGTRVSKGIKGVGAKAGKNDETEPSTQVAALLKRIADLEAEREVLKTNVEELKKDLANRPTMAYIDAYLKE